MSADIDFHCSKAPTPIPDERSVKTVKIVHEEFGNGPAGSGKGWYVLGAFLALAIVAGVVFTLVKNGSGSAATISASTEIVAEGSGSSENAATATQTDSPPKECVGEITDKYLSYYCSYLLPFAKHVAKDHERIDRLEAASKDGTPGVPLALWVVVIFIGVLTVYNTVKIHSTKDERPPG